jgi:hypothetical protein
MSYKALSRAEATNRYQDSRRQPLTDEILLTAERMALEALRRPTRHRRCHCS